MEKRYRATLLDSVNEFVNKLPRAERAKIFGAIEKMRSGDWSSIYVKTLKGPIRELIVKRNRILFFINENVLHFIHAFQKKTAKTPPKEIERAEQIYKLFMS